MHLENVCVFSFTCTLSSCVCATGYTMNEMTQLQTKAIEFIRQHGRWIPCGLFYRDKDLEYYKQCQRTGFIPPTLKNDNGDPASPINGCIGGIFLGVGVNWKTGNLPETSPFGDVRFHIPIAHLYAGYFNLYFADFYCHAGSKSHHFTLVLTRANSPADNFCRSRLPTLDRMDNLFLYQDRIRPNGWMHTTAAWVHVFYTESIPINCGWFGGVHCSRPSSNTKLGKPKNASCPVCNI